MEIEEFASSHRGFHSLPKVDLVEIFGWYLHHHKGLAAFDAAAIRRCFDQSHISPPNIHQYLTRLAERKPARLSKGRDGYKLAGDRRRALGIKYSGSPTVVAVSSLLTGLPAKVPSLTERQFLEETINCYKIGAYRAAVVMVWNLCYHHLLSWILSNDTRLQAFNDAIPKAYPNKKRTVADRDGFDEFKESEVVEILRVGKVLSKNVIQILREKLTRRNMCAHPSSIAVTQHQADDAITDLVNNVVLTLA